MIKNFYYFGRYLLYLNIRGDFLNAQWGIAHIERRWATPKLCSHQQRATPTHFAGFRDIARHTHAIIGSGTFLYDTGAFALIAQKLRHFF
jgi:hypothetical protein